MDVYMTDSLQDMLDIDIKSEMATDLASATDFSISNDGLGISLSDMPPLLDMDGDWGGGGNWVSSSSSFLHNLDLYGSEANAVMVDPASVMPSVFHQPKIKEESPDLMLNSVISRSSSPLPSPKEEKSHLTFSPSTIKIPKIKEESKEPLEEATPMVIYVRKDIVKKDLSSEIEGKKFKISSTNQPVRIKSQPEVLKINGKNCSILNANKVQQPLGAKTIISGNIHILDAQQSRLLANGGKGQTIYYGRIENDGLNGKQILKPGTYTVETAHTKYSNIRSSNGDFPKPAYSYSCLIAMALKNSLTGSLPVSEIYNFMCKHFPYFKTAPNGWKNSVRHNLSLNKCFEKIEKPSTNGGQRKGCLWAMNPSKVGKMDEEVQKWSRKDPQAIRKAMVCPESLEALERGDMKFTSEGVCESMAEGEGDGESEVEAEGEGETEADGEYELDDERAELDQQDYTIEESIEEEGEAEGDAEGEVEGEEGSWSEGELEVEELVAGTGMVGGAYTLLRARTHHYADSADEHTDIEVVEGELEGSVDGEGELEDEGSEEEGAGGRALPYQLDIALDNYRASSKRPKTSFLYQPVTASSHTSRRKTPLVNRVALI